MNIYVGNLPYNVRDDDLRGAFAKYGAVKSAQVILDKRNRRSRGYGFVEMLNDQEAQKAIAALDGEDFHGRALRVAQSNVKDEQQGRHGGRGKGGSGQRPDAARRSKGEEQKRGGVLGFLKRLFG